MLMQRVPTSYLALEKAVMYISSEMRKAKTEPVLHTLEYRLVTVSDITFLQISKLIFNIILENVAI